MNPFPETDDQKDMFWKTFDSQRWGFLGWGMNRVQSALNKQVQPVLESLQNSPQEAIANIPLVSTQPIKDVFVELYGFVGGRFARQVNESLKSNTGYYQTKQDEEGFFVRTIREWIEKEGLPRINGITENTRTHLRQALETGIDEGMGIEEIARMISGSRRIAGIQRARVIARTEIISASNKGSLEGAKQLGLDGLQKEWISTRDARTRRVPDDKFDHYSIDGQTVGINEKFIVEGRTRSEPLNFPGDPTGSPGNVIMCRCTQGYRRKK